ncbi:hypothetical protein CS537_01425 [Yersinia mollaretii]|nr:hypothetical protein CS537_01425 [Yersinia mollaretii]
MQVCWLLSFTRITDCCQLIGILLLAAFLHLEIYWVYPHSTVIFQVAGVLVALAYRLPAI